MRIAGIFFGCIMSGFLLAGCSTAGGGSVGESESTGVSPPVDDQSAEKWAIIATNLRTGALHGTVYSVNIPRADLEITHVDFGDIPVAAGLESQFHFFLCSCGKAFLIGQLCVVDDEANDVIDELRAAHIKVASMGPMFIGDRPRILMLHVQGEGEAEDLSLGLKKALRWMNRKKN